MTFTRQATGPYPQGFLGQVIRVNTILYCKQWADTVDFYKNGLQLPVTLETDWFVEFQLTDTTCLSIADACRTTMESSAGEGHLITFQVHDLKETRAWLCHAGLVPGPVKKHKWGTFVMYLRDPEGTLLEFWSD